MGPEAEALNDAAIEIVTHSPEQTRRTGQTLGENSEPGHLFLLIGDLGTGKTCLTQGILWGLGTDEYVRSPTFVLAAEYRGRVPMFHLDLYRLESAGDVIDVGIDEYMNRGGVCVVEWADRFLDLFPEDRLEARIDRLGENDRRLTLVPHGPRYAGVMRALRSAAGASV